MVGWFRLRAMRVHMSIVICRNGSQLFRDPRVLGFLTTSIFDMMDFLPIGSATWMRGKEYQDKYSKRINQFAASTKRPWSRKSSGASSPNQSFSSPLSDSPKLVLLPAMNPGLSLLDRLLRPALGHIVLPLSSTPDTLWH